MLDEPESIPLRRRPPYGIHAYTAREWDPEIDLYYYRARYYDPKVGRFISEDPIGFRAGPNFYTYVGGSPVNAIDPTGLVNVNTIEHVTTWPARPDGCWVEGVQRFACTLMTYALDIWCDPCGNMKINLTLNADIRVMEAPYPPIGPAWSTTEGGIAHERAHVRDVANLSEAFLSTFEKPYGSHEACVQKIPLVRKAYEAAFRAFEGLSQNVLQ